MISFPEVGDVVIVKWVAFSNDMGGTEMIEKGIRFKVEVTKSWYDYETGQRYHGRLLEAKDVARVRREGTTGHADQRPADRGPWDPSVVYFGSHDVVGGA